MKFTNQNHAKLDIVGAQAVDYRSEAITSVFYSDVAT